MHDTFEDYRLNFLQIICLLFTPFTQLCWLICNYYLDLVPVLSFFSGTHPGWTVGPIFTLRGSNYVFPHKKVPLGVTTINDVIWENMSS